MKNLTLLATTLFLTSIHGLPASADCVDGNKQIALVETSSTKPAGIRLFHSKRRLAFKQEMEGFVQNSEASSAADGGLGYGTDSFVITY
jgi:hypothetical protein